MPNVIDTLVRLTGLDTILKQEIAKNVQVGAINPQIMASDDVLGDLTLIEESLSQFNLITRMHRDRSMRYQDYDAMDNYGDVSVALDIYSEEATQTDLIQEDNIWVTSEEANIVDMLETMFKKLKMRTIIQGMSREIFKYGDLFIKPKFDVSGIKSLLYLPARYVQRVGPDLNGVKHYKLDNHLSKVAPRKDGILLPWECVHFRMVSFGFSTLYGKSGIEPARKRWLQLKLLEDAIAIYRLNRAVERIIFYIDVGQASPQEALRIVQQYKRKFGNKRQYLDPNAPSEFHQAYDPHNLLENYYWPINSATERSRIEKLAPPQEQGQLYDLDHFNEKLYVSLGIPRDYLTGEVSGSWNSKESLVLQDVRFSRKIHRVQESLLEGVETMCRYHIAIITGDAEYARNVPFKLHLADISKIARQQYDQILLNRVQLLVSLHDMGTQMQLRRDVWVPYILKNYFPDIPEELLGQIIISDQELAQAHDQLTQDQQPPPAQTASKKTESVGRQIMRDILEKKNIRLPGLHEEEETPDISAIPFTEFEKSFTLPHPVVLPTVWLEDIATKYSPKRRAVLEAEKVLNEDL